MRFWDWTSNQSCVGFCHRAIKVSMILAIAPIKLIISLKLIFYNKHSLIFHSPPIKLQQNIKSIQLWIYCHSIKYTWELYPIKPNALRKVCQNKNYKNSTFWLCTTLCKIIFWCWLKWLNLPFVCGLYVKMNFRH